MKTRNHLQSQAQVFTPASTREDSTVLSTLGAALGSLETICGSVRLA